MFKTDWKITYHWTGGAYWYNTEIHKAYHFIIDQYGLIFSGKYKIEDNKSKPLPLILRSNYAHHTGGENSDNIGIAFMGMAGFVEPCNSGEYPLTEKQCEVGWELGAKLALKYSIPIRSEWIATHYERGASHKRRGRKTESIGKIDIIHLPYKPELKKEEIGDYIRNKVRWYREKGGYLP